MIFVIYRYMMYRVPVVGCNEHLHKHFHALRNERSGWNAKRAAAERWALPRHNLARADPIELVRRDETGFIQSECRMIGRRPNRERTLARTNVRWIWWMVDEMNVERTRWYSR